MKKFMSLFLVTVTVLSLAACTPAAPPETQAPTTAAPTTAAQTVPTAEVTEEAGEASLQKLYETTKVTVSFKEMLEDSESYHVILKAENRTGDPLNLEIPAIAFNGITAQNSAGWFLPANGNAYLYMNYYKDQLKSAGLDKKPGALMIGVRVYDENYERIDEGVCECVLDGANSSPASLSSGKTVYEENGIRISSLGIGGEGTEKYVRLCLENSSEEMLCLNGSAAVAPGEELTASAYAYVLPGTKTVCEVSFYSADYSANVDPQSLPFVNMLFQFSYDGGNAAFMTEPVKIDLGTEGRFTLSEDGTEVVMVRDEWLYENCEWVATTSDKDVLSIKEVKDEKDVPETGRQQVTAAFRAEGAGSSRLQLRYHPVGESMEATEDYWPTVYFDRSIRFKVTEEGKIEPDDITLEVPNISGEGDNGWWYYTFRNDGTLVSKETAAG